MKTLKLRLTDLLEVSDLVLKANKIHLRVVTGSMSPAIREGDLLQVEPISPDKLQIGDILLYQNQKRLICHRLAQIYKNRGKAYLVTKADRSSTLDPPILVKQILGRVVNIEKASWARYIWLSKIKKRIGGLLLQIIGLKGYEWLRKLFSYNLKSSI